MTERSSTSTPDDDRVGAMAEKLGASRQMSLTQAVAYWKDRAEMAERRNLLNPEGCEYVAELEARLERQQAVIEAQNERLRQATELLEEFANGLHPWGSVDAWLDLATLTQEEPDD